MTPVTDAAPCSGMNRETGQPPWRGAPPSVGGQGDEWAAYVVLDTYDEDVPRDRLRERVLWRRSARSSRGSNDPPRSPRKPEHRAKGHR